MSSLKEKIDIEEEKIIAESGDELQLILDSFVVTDCPLCHGEFDEVSVEMHRKFGMHTTNGVCWKPEKGHKDYELHTQYV